MTKRDDNQIARAILTAFHVRYMDSDIKDRMGGLENLAEKVGEAGALIARAIDDLADSNLKVASAIAGVAEAVQNVADNLDGIVESVRSDHPLMASDISTNLDNIANAIRKEE
jgi:hypothetical protein